MENQIYRSTDPETSGQAARDITADGSRCRMVEETLRMV